MPTTKNLMGAGLVPLQATSILGSVANGLTATGVGQSDALALTSDLNVFSTVATGTGARLQANLARGDEITVANNGANALLVYPPTGAAIGTAATNAGVSVAAGKLGVFTLITPTLFIASVGA
jgi:hypothetical protein